MSNPRIEVDLSKIRQNTQTLVRRLKLRGIGVTGVTKAVCGHPAIAQAMLDGGAVGLAEARLSNVHRLRNSGITCSINLIRSPMLSQVDQVVQVCESSYNTEMVVIAALAASAIRHNTVHGVILMVEMGDLREGITPSDLGATAQKVMDIPGVALKGVGANFACLSGTVPDAAKMAALSDLATTTESVCATFLQTVSGGNSANLPWACGHHSSGRINDLRLGEAILLGVDPVSGEHLRGLHTDAFTLVAEVIETNTKPVLPVARFADPALAKLHLIKNNHGATRLILAIGHQDTDIDGLTMPPGNMLVGATSDHMIVRASHFSPSVGTEMRFQMNYSALMHAMAAPDIDTMPLRSQPLQHALNIRGPSKHLTLA